MRRALLVSISLVSLLAGASIAAADEASDEDANAVISPLAISVVSTPRVVAGADDLQHLAYELLFVNQTDGVTTIDAIEVVDPSDDDTIVSSYNAEKLAPVLRLSAGGDDTTIVSGASAMAFLDVTFPAEDTVPRELAHRFELTFQGAADPQTGVVPDAQQIDFVGVPTDVDTRAPVVVSPPLAGSGWVVGNGCCDALDSHRGATLAIDGTIRVPERFAIDFVQLGPNGALAQGDPTTNESFGYFGDEVLAAAPGKVVRIQDGLEEQTPGALPAGATVRTAGGNYVVVDIGRGRYAFYAHLQPGSLKVEVGDRVKAGDVLGLLGNTGNTNAPHLHFHIMDSPSPLRSDGLPFELTSFTGEGIVTDEEILANQPATPVPVDDETYAGPHTKQLPLNLEVVGFAKD